MKGIFRNLPPAADDLMRLVSCDVPAGHHLVYHMGDFIMPPSNQALAQHVAALANTHGGFVVLGVETEGDLPQKITGYEAKPELLLLEVQRAIEDNVYPPVDTEVTVIDVGDGRIAITVEVPPSLDAPHRANGVYPQRSGRETVAMTAAEIDRVRAHRRKALEELRSRARELVELAQSGRIVDAHVGDLSLFLYVVSIPAFLSGTRLQVSDYAMSWRPSMWSLGESRGEVPLGRTFDGLLGTRQDHSEVSEFVLLSHHGELLHGLLDASPLAGKGPGCIDVSLLESALFEALPANLATAEKVLSLEPPYYVALVTLGKEGFGKIEAGLRCSSIRGAHATIDTVLPLGELRRLRSARVEEMGENAYKCIQAAALRPLLDRLYQAAGSVSPWPERIDNDMCS